MKTLTLSAKLLKHLGSIEVGNYVTYAVDAEFGGGWKVELIGRVGELARKDTVEEALAFIEANLDD